MAVESTTTQYGALAGPTRRRYLSSPSLHNCEVGRAETTRLRDCETARLRDCETARLRHYDTTTLRHYDTTILPCTTRTACCESSIRNGPCSLAFGVPSTALHLPSRDNLFYTSYSEPSLLTAHRFRQGCPVNLGLAISPLTTSVQFNGRWLVTWPVFSCTNVHFLSLKHCVISICWP